jgi:signal transduction histidine kinase
MRNGTWPVNQTLYEFFAAEIDSRLSPLRDQGRLAEIRASMEELRGQPSPHLKALIFTDLLRTEALTEIRRKVATLPTIGAGQKGRFVVGSGNDATLISFSVLPEFKNQGTCLGGLYWEPGSLKEGALPQILDAISHDSGLRLQLIGESGRDVVTGEERTVFTNTVTLPFGRLPFPWKLVASQLARHDLEREVRRDNVLYGVFLAVIVTLMFLGAILILRDISREKETTRQRSEFVNNISHEFKTPLTLIRLYSETLERQEGLSREEKNEAYEIITKEAERLTHMINNVLDFSRIEMGRKEFNFKSGDLSEIIRTTLNSYRYHLEKKGFLIHTEIAADVPPMEFDEEAIAGVLINLLSNATKFSSDRKEVTVRLFQKGPNIVFQVEDKGIGISAKESGRIFEKFYQVKNEGLTEAGGSGLGLSLVKHVIEAHGGEVQVESEPGKGSAFSVILPVERPASRGK